MKKIIAAALAASLVATPVIAAPNYNNNGNHYGQTVRGHDNGRGYNNRDYNNRGEVRRAAPVRQTVVHQTVVRNDARHNQHRQWRTGQRFDRQYATNYREIRNYGNYRLRTPPRGYHWVQSGNDAILVGITSGIISAILSNALR